MKKIILFVFTILSLLIFSGVEASTSFQVKKTTDTSYSTSLSSVTNGEELTFRIIRTDSTASDKTFSLAMPSGFVYNSYTAGAGCTNFSLSSNSNSSFSYTYSGSSVCSLTFKYTPTTATAGTKTVNLVYNSSILSSVSIGIITGSSTISSASSKDLDSDGYIDAYLVNFSSAITDTNGISGLTVGGQSVTSYSGNTSSGYIVFPDGVFQTGDLPQIVSSSSVFGNVGTISNGTITEEDGATPVLLKVNNQSISGGNSVSIGTGNIVFEFSENLHPNSYLGFTLSGATGNFSVSNDELTFTPTVTMTVGNYYLTSNALAKDYSSNQNTLAQINITLIISDTTAPTGNALSSGTGIIMNNGSSSTNNRYVQLTLSASDNVGVEDMKIYNSGDTGTWENYSTSKTNWDLGAITGTKTVYVKFRDIAGNESSAYSSSIIYSTETSYITFDDLDSLYTSNSTITLSGGCNYVTSTGAVISTTINYSINDGASSSFSCNSTTKRWSNNFSLTSGTTNEIKLWYGADYNSATTKNSITITQSTTSCDPGYTRVGGSCIPNSCSAQNVVVNGRTYQVPAISHGNTSNITSNTVNITGGTITYTQSFSCSLGNLSTSGSETYNSPSCTSGYTVVGSTCSANGCSAQSVVVNGRTYQVPGLASGNTSSVTSNSISITGGSLTYSQSFSCSLGSLTTSGGETTNTPSCNSGYSVSGSSCVQSSSGGGGGGGGGGAPTTCYDRQLVCNNGIYYRKPGISCNGGNLGKACTPGDNNQTTSSGGTNNNTNGNDNSIFGNDFQEYLDNLGKETEVNSETVKSYLLENTSKSLAKLVNNYGDKLNINNIDYFSTFDSKLKKDYNNLLLSYKNLFENIDNYLTEKDKDYLKEAAENYKNFSSLYNKVKEPELKYISKKESGKNIVYQTNVSSLKNSMGKIELLMISKYNKLLSSKTITETEYKTMIDDYNNFILNLSIFKMYDSDEAKNKAKEYLTKVIKNYNKKVSPPKIVITKKIYDVFPISRNLTKGDSGDDVLMLQNMLAYYGYFNLEANSYFGNGTNESLKNFTTQFLKLNYNGTFDETSRNKLKELDY